MRVKGLGLRVWGVGFGFDDLRFGISGFGFRGWGLRRAVGLGIRDYGLGLMAESLGLKT